MRHRRLQTNGVYNQTIIIDHKQREPSKELKHQRKELSLIIGFIQIKKQTTDALYGKNK